jgi:hypothetical protein
MQERLKKELEASHSDLGAFRDYGETRISLAPDAIQKLGVLVPSKSPGPYAPEDGHAAGRKGGNGESTSSFAIPSIGAMDIPEGCRFCGGTLPEGRPVIYCPHCGQNLAAKHCAGCGAELDPTWKFCINCGKKSV